MVNSMVFNRVSGRPLDLINEARVLFWFFFFYIQAVLRSSIGMFASIASMLGPPSFATHDIFRMIISQPIIDTIAGIILCRHRIGTLYPFRTKVWKATLINVYFSNVLLLRCCLSYTKIKPLSFPLSPSPQSPLPSSESLIRVNSTIWSSGE